MEEMYLIYHKFVGNSPLFWAKGGNGYTQWLDDAETFTEEEADKIIKGTQGSHDFKKVLLNDMESIARRTVDMQDFHKLKEMKNERPIN